MQHPCLPLLRGQIGEAEADIAGHRQPWQQTRLLKHDADRRMRALDGFAIDGDGARGRAVQSGDQAQQGGFAATRTADQRENFAIADLQADLAQRFGAVRIGF